MNKKDYVEVGVVLDGRQVRVAIDGKIGERAVIRPLDLGTWEAVRKHLLTVAGGLFHHNEEPMLTSVLSPGALMDRLCFEKIIVL